MADPEHVEIVRLGAKSLKTWRIQNPDVSLNLFEADLSGADLRGANLIDVDLSGADLSRADLTGAYLSGARLTGARIDEARLSRARLIGSRLNRARLRRANLSKANLRHANLTSADFSEANLTGVKVRGAQLRGADLGGTNLTWAKLIGNSFDGVRFPGALCGWTVFADADLSRAEGLEEVEHCGPSTMGVDSLVRSAGRIPEPFLEGCGFSPWQIAESQLYRPELSESEAGELRDRVFQLRTQRPWYAGGVFIAFDANDAEFAGRLTARIRQEGLSCWPNLRSAAAGAFPPPAAHPPLGHLLQPHDVAILVLSKASAAGDWVEHEMDAARTREKSMQRDVLFPVALDDAWKAKLTDTSWKAKLEDLYWRHNKQKLVVDFSNWGAGDFETQFQTLFSALKIPERSTVNHL